MLPDTMSAQPAPLTSGAPTTRDENWKYANLRALSRLPFDESAVDTPTSSEDPATLPDKIAPHRIVLLDGRLSRSLSDPLPTGCVIRTGKVDELGNASVDRHYLQVNRRRRAETLGVHVAQGGKLDLEILCIATRLGQPAIAIQLDSNAHLTLSERHLSLGAGAAATNLAVEIALGDHAKLELARWQHFEARASHIETIELSLGQSAECHLTQITSADRAETAVSSRSTAFVTHAGEGSSLYWNSAIIADGQQQHDAYVRIDHRSRGAQTHQLFRGIASGRSKMGFNGHMYVGETALGAHSGQSLKTLLAGSEAEANVRPQLEIYTNEVTATHGATVGKLDGDMLFYLLSRGIDPETAESLLKWAFISDVLTHLPSSDLRHHIEASLIRQLPGAIAAQEALLAERGK